MHRYQRGGRGGGRPSGNAGGAGGSAKEWTYGLHTYINGVFTAVPLASVRTDARVLNYGAEVTFTQTYKNTGAAPLDATYLFPVPFQGTVTNFEANIDGVNIITHVRDRNSAPKERADDPNNQAPIMFVTEQDRLYLQLKAIVPNIPAGKTVNFKLTYVTEITVDEERLRLSIPLKFTTVKRPPKPDAGAVAPPPASNPQENAPIDLSVALEMPDAITSVETNGASVFQLTGQQSQAGVTLTSKNFVPYDFNVITRLANPRNNRVSIESHPSNARLAILDFFVPGLQNFHYDKSDAHKEKGKEADKAKETEKEKDGVKEADKVEESAKEPEGEKKESIVPLPAAAAAATPTSTASGDAAKESKDAKEDIAAPAAVHKRHGKKRFCASDISIECSDKTLNFVALPVTPAVTKGRVILFAPLPADFAGATVSVGPKDAPGVVQLQIDNTACAVNSTIGHRLYARAFIREMEGELESRPTEARAEELRKAVVALSTRFGVTSSLTTFVAYEKHGEEEKEIAPLIRNKRLPPKQPKEVPAAAAPAAAIAAEERKIETLGEKKERPPKREKPAAKPSATKLADGAHVPAPAPAAVGKAPAHDGAHGHAVGQQPRQGQLQSQSQNQSQQQQQRQQRRDAPRTQEHEASTLFRSLSKLQNHFGAWGINRSLADVICIDLNDVQSAIRTQTMPGVARVWATAIAMAFIELGGFDKDPSERHAVEVVMQRARKWMTETVPGKEAEWLNKAKAFVSDHIELVDA